jgi:hypothetical protein
MPSLWGISDFLWSWGFRKLEIVFRLGAARADFENQKFMGEVCRLVDPFARWGLNGCFAIEGCHSESSCVERWTDLGTELLARYMSDKLRNCLLRGWMRSDRTLVTL